MKYLERYAHYKEALISQSVSEDTGIIIVIPCFNEPDIVPTLQSLNECSVPNLKTEVLVVINASETATDSILETNQKTAEQIHLFISSENPGFDLHIIIQNELPQKHAGVGLARKIGMDEAVRRFHQIGKLWDGIIVCLDADSLVEPNYLVEIEKHFIDNPKTPACSIHFEHPLDQENAEQIINYELHLRYFINAQRWAGHPHAFQTVGSSMAVRAEIYAKQGGMPKRQAGEDFYFLHKIIPLGHFTELNTTKTIPSPRTSDRVPFGTGKDIGDQLSIEQKEDYTTYNFEAFVHLKTFIETLDLAYSMDSEEFMEIQPMCIVHFLMGENIHEKLAELKKHTSNFESFRNRFFQWFNGFLIMKYCHAARDLYFPNQSVESQSKVLLELLNATQNNSSSKKQFLTAFRKLDINPNTYV